MRSWQPLPELLEPETRRLVERLRSLKEETGMSLAELARRTAHSKSAWHRYLNGRMFPPRSAVEALARLVQADELQLVELWTHAQHVHARCESLPRQSSPAPGAPSAVPTLLRRRIAVVAVLVLVAAAVAWVIAGAGPSRIASQVPVETTTASARPPGEHAAPACTGETCEGQYPAPSGCDRDARTESSVSTSGYSVQLRFSPSCGTVWAEVHSRAGRVREILIKVEPKDKLTDPPNDRFPTTSPMLATTTPQAAEACAIVEEQLACTSAGGQEISLVACPSHTDGLRSNDQCVAARPAAGLPLAGSGGTGGRRRP